MLICSFGQVKCYMDKYTKAIYLFMDHTPASCIQCTILKRERGGSVVERLTRDRRAAGSSLTGVTVLWSLSKTHLS